MIIDLSGKTCNCGSGLLRHELTDARGIFCAYVCDNCEDAHRQKYRRDIFTDSNYECDERIGEDY